MVTENIFPTLILSLIVAHPFSLLCDGWSIPIINNKRHNIKSVKLQNKASNQYVVTIFVSHNAFQKIQNNQDRSFKTAIRVLTIL